MSFYRWEAKRGPVNNDECQLRHLDGVSCVMISCCSGAELQVRRGEEIVLRELYPSKSDLYERANDLKTELLSRSGVSQWERDAR